MSEPLTDDEIRRRDLELAISTVRECVRQRRAAGRNDIIVSAERLNILVSEIDRLRAEVSKLKAANGHLEQEVRIMRAREITQ